MTKAEEFLWVVQTIILTNGINLATDPETNVRYRHVFSAIGVGGILNDALWAKDRIPDEMSAFDAAMEFTDLMLCNIREADEKATGERMPVPHWFARH